MMRSLATVVAVETGRITVSCQQQTSCGSCGSRDSCGTGIVSKALPGRRHEITIATREKASVGDTVEIGLSERSMLQSALLVYVLPLLGLVLGAILGQWWFVSLAGGGELGVIVTALGFAGAGLWLARRLATRLEGDSAYQPTLIRVLGTPVSASLAINAIPKDSD
ncbi:transcriptional regulator [Photobacterium ganghwense]|uniref:Sigma-E factor regulatory protein n=1 Tax=Photobacterium ganghwense TaxID=320778 RepID=A0A0J1JW27_9GAMM|nr:SoxR reducing system RseC family protein [Photobacterium ganghwense]KLV06502.1 sigma-E factor regulatory protein [Photobacterium ganghwense]PSU06613.1 transcriptional regulator [Photobacterium ganghwense]QSV14546.1 SoxR reducing system RseC family protein [Photobacterium ganghwense]